MTGLLDPLSFGRHTAPNRVVFGPHVTNLGRGRALSERHVHYYGERAAGGAGLIVVEVASVHESDWPYERAPLAADCGAAWGEISRRCHREGAIVVAGIGHAGGQGSSAYHQRALLAPSPVPDVLTREVPVAMEESDLQEIVVAFGAAAAAAVSAGCAGVEVNAGQWSLLRQFCSRLTNHRQDELGADPSLFVRRVLAAVRASTGPNSVVGLRWSADEMAPWAGLVPDTAAAMVAAIVAGGGVDYVTVERGSAYGTGATVPDGHDPAGFNLEAVAAVRAALPPAVAVVAQGSIVEPEMAADIIKSGRADLVEMTRALIADPFLVRKVAAGERRSVRPCVLCNQACQVRDPRNPVVSCIGEPRAGYETVDPVTPESWGGSSRLAVPARRESEQQLTVGSPGGGAAGRAKRPALLVVGGGPAGLECGRVAAAGGLDVTVLEQERSFGGMVLAACRAPGRQRLAQLTEWLESECRAAGAKLVCGHEVLLEELDSHDGPVVCCTGSRPGRRSYVLGPLATVLSAADVLRAERLPGDGVPSPAVVWDPVGGPAGVGAAELLAAVGASVTLVTPDFVAGEQLARSGDLAPANVRLQRAGVEIVRTSVVRSVEQFAVVVEERFSGAVRSIDAALLVDAAHRLPEDSLHKALSAFRPAVIAGDAVAPRTILEAVLEGRRAAMGVLEECGLLDRTAAVGVVDGSPASRSGVDGRQGPDTAGRAGQAGGSRPARPSFGSHPAGASLGSHPARASLGSHPAGASLGSRQARSSHDAQQASSSQDSRQASSSHDSRQGRGALDSRPARASLAWRPGGTAKRRRSIGFDSPGVVVRVDRLAAPERSVAGGDGDAGGADDAGGRRTAGYEDQHDPDSAPGITPAGDVPASIGNASDALAGAGSRRRPTWTRAAASPSQRYPLLFSPLRIGPVTVANRVVFAAHLTNFASDGVATEQHAAYYAARAAGGAGLVITEEHSTHPSDWPYEKLIHGYLPAVIPTYRRMTAAVHRHGVPIFAQINHNGGQASSMYSRRPVWAPSPVADPLFREVPHAVDEDEIAEIVAGYVTVAEHCKAGGFDGVELQCSHSSIVRGFLSPATNLRTDRYGGSLEGRASLLLELLAAVRAAVGEELAVGIRLCGDELIEGGTTIDEAVAVAKLVEEQGCADYVNTSIGVATATLFMIEASMHVPPGYASFIPSAIRDAVSLPVVGVGRFKDPLQAERALEHGSCDLVGIVRGQIADPDFVAKARSGRTESIRLCLSCNQECVGRMGLNRWLGCIENTATGREAELAATAVKVTAADEAAGEREPAGPDRRAGARWFARAGSVGSRSNGGARGGRRGLVRDVIVVGAGPAGLQAAIAAAERGHRVTVLERAGEPGGQVRLAASVPNRAEFGDLVRNQLIECRRLAVELELGVEVTASEIRRKRPDVVVVATGSRPRRPFWVPEALAEGIGVADVTEVLGSPAEAMLFGGPDRAERGGRVLVVDEVGFHQATSTAELLADRGCSVEIVTPAMVVGQDLGITLDLEGFQMRAAAKGIRFATDRVVVGAADGALQVLHHPTGEMERREVDWVVLAVPALPDDELYLELRRLAPDLPARRAGDCVAPRRAHAAVLEGARGGGVVLTSVVAVVPVREGELCTGGDEALAEAGGSGVLIGSGADALACELLRQRAARSLGAIESASFRPGQWAQVVAPAVAESTVVVLPASADGRDLAPRLAVALGRPLVAGALRVTAGGVAVVRWQGRQIAHVAVDGPFVATLLPGSRSVPDPPAEALEGSAPAEGAVPATEPQARPMGSSSDSAAPAPAGNVRAAAPATPPADSSSAASPPAERASLAPAEPASPAPERASPAPAVAGVGPSGEPAGAPLEPELIELQTDPGGLDLRQARRIIAGGAGLGGAEDFALLFEVAGRLEASWGATRVVTDAGIVPHDRQIGTTGVSVRPRCYVAFGISGAAQHVGGLGAPDHVISVNLDRSCPMSSMADLAIVADAPEVLRALAARLAVAAVVAG